MADWTVFEIRHEPTGVAYFARTRNLASAIKQHRKKLNGQLHDNEEVQAAYDFYGPSDFAFNALAEGLTASEAWELVQLTIECVGRERTYNLPFSTKQVRAATAATMRPVRIHGEVYPSIESAARRLGISGQTISSRLGSLRQHQYCYVDQNHEAARTAASIPKRWSETSEPLED